ncbi:protein turtle-like [Centruroides sculpturatus]|uniref:protein turtle-like n=1 Tax=Centruroides sculpturatus TaxID=218467 RepID=UPI000C6D0782|nr:protein turtle-like [Centruroides sculpturatus]
MLGILALFVGFNVLYYASSKAVGDFINYTGIEGQKVLLPCDITPFSGDDIVMLILWYKDDNTIVYSIDSRHSPLSEASHVARESLAGRSYFTTLHRPPYLAIDNLKVEDEGMYRCRVDFVKSQTRNFYFYLNIVVPASKPIIKDLRGEVLNNIIGPFPEGFHLILICEVDKGRPVPSVTWWNGSHLIDSTYTMTSNNILRNELIVGELKRNHLMRSFTCQASNSNITLPASTTVILNVTLKPVDVKIIGERHPLSANTVHHVTCSTRGSLPSVHISWWKGSVKLVSNREEIIENGNATLNYLTFVPSADDNGKFLVCRAHNPSITPSTLEDSWKLDVHYVPQLNLRLGRNYSNIKEGTDVHFECDIRANPPINKVGWRFRNQDLASNASKDILILNQTLYLKNIQRSSRGHYTCIATNSEGTGESNSVYLRVKFSPICKQQEILTVATVNKPINATCQVEADPSFVDIFWKSNSTVPIRYDVKGTTSVAFYLPKSPEDIQDLLCWAVNSVGIQKSPCVVKLVPAGQSKAVVLKATTLSPPGELTFKEKGEDFIYSPALIVAGSVLVIVILAVAIILRAIFHQRIDDDGGDGAGVINHLHQMVLRAWHHLQIIITKANSSSTMSRFSSILYSRDYGRRNRQTDGRRCKELEGEGEKGGRVEKGREDEENGEEEEEEDDEEETKIRFL